MLSSTENPEREVARDVSGDASRRRSRAHAAKNFRVCNHRRDTSRDRCDVIGAGVAMSARIKFLAKRMRFRVARLHDAAEKFSASSDKIARAFHATVFVVPSARETTREAVIKRKKFVARTAAAIIEKRASARHFLQAARRAR